MIINRNNDTLNDRLWSKDELNQLEDEVLNQHLPITDIASTHRRAVSDIKDKIIEKGFSYEPSLRATVPTEKYIDKKDENMQKLPPKLFYVLRPFVSDTISNDTLAKNVATATEHLYDKPIHLWDYISRTYSNLVNRSDLGHYFDINTSTILGVKKNTPESIQIASKEIVKQMDGIIQSNIIESNRIVICSVPGHNKDYGNNNGISKVAKIVANTTGYVDGSNFIIRTKSLEKGVTKAPSFKQLTGADRMRKVLDTLKISSQGKDAIDGSWVFLLDDVVTTGFTHRLLQLFIYAHGAKRVTFISLGRTRMVGDYPEYRATTENIYRPDVFLEALLRCTGIGPAVVLKFLRNNNLDIGKCKNNLRHIIKDVTEFTQNVHYAENKLSTYRNVHVESFTVFDKDYPSKLLDIPTPILRLYYRGNIDLLDKPSIAIVGTRHPDSIGIQDTCLLTQNIAPDFVTVSGLAMGVDKLVHEETLKMGKSTIAVLPSNLIDISPSSNKELSEQIVDNDGLLVTEHLPSDKLSRYDYPKRNRIQAAIANAIVVPAASNGSGTENTVKNAVKMNKPVFKSMNCSAAFFAEKINPASSMDLQEIKDVALSNYARQNSDNSEAQQLPLL